jgi:NAD(P)-dependent dehydrogenase (short-subunit alcohol dehydrogenase family)
MVRKYEGRVAVITGAGSGFGRALAKELATRNCNLALVDIDSSAVEKTRRELARPGIMVTDHFADVGSEQSLEFVATEVKKVHGAVHLLINNAGVSASASFLSTEAAEFDRIMRVNFFGAVYGCRVSLPLLQEHSQGQILNVSSCFAWLGYPRKTAYASSKGALRAFSESRICKSGVGVTALYPGPLHTSLVRSGISDSAGQRDPRGEIPDRSRPSDRARRPDIP